jgi:hypothetical protein
VQCVRSIQRGFIERVSLRRSHDHTSLSPDAVKLKDKNLSEIEEDLERLSTRIEFVVNRDATKFVELKKDSNFDKFFPVFEASPQDEVTGKDFPALKRFAERAASINDASIRWATLRRALLRTINDHIHPARGKSHARTHFTDRDNSVGWDLRVYLTCLIQ